MNIRFNIEKSQRKALAQKIGELTGAEVKYLGVPGCGYQIGSYTLDKECVLHGEEISDDLRDALEQAGYAAEPEPEQLTVTIPKDYFTGDTLANFRQIVENKATLIKHALGADELPIMETEEGVDFPWFTVTKPEDGKAYIQFISMLATFAKDRKRVINKPDTSDNEKFSFRCFLIRIGMVGSDFKNTRKVLLRNLTGSSAFRNGKPEKTEGGADDAVSE